MGSSAGLSTSPAWIADGDQDSAHFGASIACAGDVNADGYSDVIVGANQYSNGQFDEGGAFLYLGSPSGLETTAAWTAEADQVGAAFGQSVSSAGDVNCDGYSDVLVGASNYHDGEIGEGMAFLYLGSATGLAVNAAWTNESNQADAALGLSVASAGDVNGDGYGDVIVGADFYDNGESDEGRTFLYLGSPSGLASSPIWTAEADQALAHLGKVASAGDVNGDGYGDVVVGAYGFDNGESDEGRAYLYLGSASGLTLNPAWTTEGQQVDASFGASVWSAGDVNGDGYSDVLVGGFQYDNGETDEGRAFLYLGSGLGLSTSPVWTAESNQPFGDYGASVASAGDVNGDGYGDVIIGAPVYDNGQTNEGRAYVYYGSPGTLSTSPAWTAESDQAGAQFGVSVSTAGDVNGDGYGDVIVGALGYDHGQYGEGRAFVYHGSAGGLSTSSAWIAESDRGGAWFGNSVASAGDVNGDGYGDVIVGAPHFADPEGEEGRAYVYCGSALGLSPTPAWAVESNQTNALFGYSISTAGDVNGDGYGDVIVGAPFYNSDLPGEGRAYVYEGSAGGLATIPTWIVESNQAYARFGESVAGAGDVNGDGFSDVVVGSLLFTNGESNEGRAFLFCGSRNGLSTTPAWTAEPDQAAAQFGISVACAGDVNGDGFSDVIVGAFAYDNGESAEGRTYVYHGSPGGLPPVPAWTAESNQAFGFFGFSVSSAGDVNGDGYGDVTVGAYQYDGAQSDQGRAYLYLGSSSGLASSPAWTADADQAFASFGVSVCTAGDVNGDGYGDLIVGANFYTNGQSGEGRAFVYYGNELGAPTVRPRQRRVNGGPMALLDRSDEHDTFRLSAEFDRDLAGHAWAKPGTASARLQWEVAPLGMAFDGIPDGASPPQTISGASLFFDQLVNGLDPGTPYHWRARIATDNPLFPTTPWFTLQAKAVTETKFRTRALRTIAAAAPTGSATRTVP